ncbi:hypothetical protein RDI58_023743 [Solanum bulbocastanum]|uniref:Pyridoxal phosphate homeostasis protein n=1 Tax=Solanum bulbocastanum TaxID=147425 RepID=A0AAN8Y2U8_SOLBU
MAAPAAEGLAVTALRSVIHRVRQAAERSGRRADDVRVVAVSKTKPISLITQVYEAGHRCFGENYVQEIIQKAPELPEDIEWHYIGHLQSNKAKQLLSTGSSKYLCDLLFCYYPISLNYTSIDITSLSIYFCGFPTRGWKLCDYTTAQLVLANYLDRAVSSIGRQPLKVLVQVNTSGEESKSGVDPSNCIELAKHVKLDCPNLEFSGLMTIGRPDYTSTPENFKTLLNCRTEVCKVLGMAESRCELSMGMSSDFELAIEMGSTNVRIGSTIFGPREYPKRQ